MLILDCDCEMDIAVQREEATKAGHQEGFKQGHHEGLDQGTEHEKLGNATKLTELGDALEKIAIVRGL